MATDPGPLRLSRETALDQPAAARTWRILLIDDSAEIRFLLRLGLEACGPFKVVGEAAEGEEGIRTASSREPDAIVVDLTMPGMGGRQAIPGLHRAAPGAVVIVYSSEPVAPSDPLLAGGEVDEVVMKSGAVDELALALTAALSRR